MTWPARPWQRAEFALMARHMRALDLELTMTYPGEDLMDDSPETTARRREVLALAAREYACERRRGAA